MNCDEFYIYSVEYQNNIGSLLNIKIRCWLQEQIEKRINSANFAMVSVLVELRLILQLLLNFMSIVFIVKKIQPNLIDQQVSCQQANESNI